MAIPQSFICPITMSIMKDPWSDTDGNTYEKTAIFEWVSREHNSPITRNPLEVSDLHPNRALKDMIEDFHSSNIISTTQVAPVIAPVATHEPVRIVAIIDKSGSMSENCDVATSKEKLGFNRLDLVKHTIKTIIKSLSPSDEFGVVTFNNTASVMTKLTHITEANISNTIQDVEALVPDGGTNIWDSLRVAINMIAEYPQDKPSHLLLFTDGESNADPPRGIITTLREYLAARPSLNVVINTYGFGNNINSELLFDIAYHNTGLFGFIPDATMIGTVFINSLAYIMTQQKYIPTDETKELIQKIADTIERAIYTAMVGDNASHILEQFCSSLVSTSDFVRDVLIDFKPSMSSSDGQIAKAVVSTYYNVWGKHYLRSVMNAYSNYFCLNFKDHGVQHFKTDEFNSHQKKIEDIFINMDPPKPSGHVDYYYNAPFMRSINRSLAQGWYVSPPSPTPVTARTFSQTYYNTDGGCIGIGTPVRISSGEYVAVENIKSGMQVISRSGPATITHVIKMLYNGTLYSHGTSTLTGYHPVYINNKWCFPAETSTFTPTTVSDTYVYDFILDNGDSVDINGMFAITLGHKIEGDSVASHDYFGTHRIIDDLKKHVDWSTGYVCLDNYSWKRDSVINRVIGLLF